MFFCISLPAQDGTHQAPTAPAELTIESIYQEGGLLGRVPESVKWSPDGTKVSFLQRDDSGEHATLYYVDVAGGKPAVLVASEKLATLVPPVHAMKDERQREAAQRYSIAAYHWSPDSKKLLFNAMGQLWLFSLENGIAVEISAGADRTSDPKFSPDGEHISFVRKHNLYVRGVNDGKEHALTRDDDIDLLNGEVDWVYEEELNVRSNYFWSPNGKEIALLQMNEREVPSYPITDWIPINPDVDRQKYPRPGDPNPTARLGVVGTGGGKVKWITAGGAKEGSIPLGGDPNVYIPRFGWVRDGLLWALALNRGQDRLDLYFIDVQSGKSKLMMTESSDAWINPDFDFQLLPSGDGYLWTSWRDGYTHIYRYRFDKADPLTSGAKLVAQLTHGEWEVSGIEAIDDTRGVVYFRGNEGDWRQENVFAVGLDGKNLHRVSKANGTHHPNFDPKNLNYYVDNFSALTTPPSLSLCTVGGSCNPFWKSRDVEAYQLLAPHFVDFKAADGTTTLLGEILLPQNGPMMSNGKVPLILHPYGGPGAQEVRDAWSKDLLFDEVMVRRGFAILQVDNRGMANRGKAFAKVIKHDFGKNELADQVAALKQALEKYPQLDASRVGFWGWSYGGCLTLFTLEHSEAFKGGVAVAPVTDWRLYDSIYTERYMGLPRDNPEGYRKSSPVNFAADLRGSLLEAHGTSDDNVHLQNTMEMANQLISAGKQFKLMLYPRKTHGIAGAAARTHLFHMMEDHFEEILAPAK